MLDIGYSSGSSSSLQWLRRLPPKAAKTMPLLCPTYRATFSVAVLKGLELTQRRYGNLLAVDDGKCLLHAPQIFIKTILPTSPWMMENASFKPRRYVSDATTSNTSAGREGRVFYHPRQGDHGTCTWTSKTCGAAVINRFKKAAKKVSQTKFRVLGPLKRGYRSSPLGPQPQK